MEACDEGRYTVSVPSWLYQRGKDRRETLANIREAIELYLEPVEDELFISEGKEIKEVVV